MLKVNFLAVNPGGISGSSGKSSRDKTDIGSQVHEEIHGLEKYWLSEPLV
jgi:hypothetical protein